MNEKMTILVCTCDKYDDAWEPFATLLSKYWPNLDCRIILNTESKTFHHDGLEIETFNLYKSGQNVPYGERMKAHLDRITTPYTFLLLDDFFIREPVDVAKIEELIANMDKDPQIAAFNFDFFDDPNNKPSEYPGFVLRPEIGHYKLNMQAGLWRTSVLNEMWHNNDSPWTWELYGTSRTFDNRYKIYSLDNLSHSPIKYGRELFIFGLYRGKWVRGDVCRLFEKENITVDFEKRGFHSDACSFNITGNSTLAKIKSGLVTLPKKYIPIWFLITIKNKLKALFRKDSTPDSFIDYLIRKKY